MLLEAGLVIITSCLVYFWWKLTADPPNFPKGPRGLPIIGNLHQMAKEPHKTFIEMGKKYGDIFSLKLGNFRAVVLNNHKDIREAFSQNAFSGRPNFAERIDRCGGKPRGILYNIGQSWQDQRRFTIRTLRDFGFGTKSMEGMVNDEITELIDTFRKLVGQPVQMEGRFSAAALNALWTIVTGERLSHNDPATLDIVSRLNSTTTHSRAVALYLFFPWIYKLSSKIPGSHNYFRGKLRTDKMGFINKMIVEHKRTLKRNEPPRDYIDVYLAEMKRTTDTGSSFYGVEGYKNLSITTYDMFLAGAETTSTTMSWMFLLLAMYPEKQEKLFEEIKQVVGLSRNPQLNDRPLMPYTEAVIQECMRLSSIIPTSLFHATTEDTTFRGYFIPKGTIIIPNLYNAMHDPSVWTNPEEFIPERFLSENGKSVTKPDAWMPFSVGKRICLGMPLALDELFLFTSSLVQTFRVAGENLKIDYCHSLVLVPKPQDLVLHERANEA